MPHDVKPTTEIGPLSIYQDVLTMVSILSVMAVYPYFYAYSVMGLMVGSING